MVEYIRQVFEDHACCLVLAELLIQLLCVGQLSEIEVKLGGFISRSFFEGNAKIMEERNEKKKGILIAWCLITGCVVFDRLIHCFCFRAEK